ncbi:MAG TPA: A24 family peptidase [Patescibacteria group bacterium]|nr:A24 family peptidase [Patescibacteria group bacterium]
MDMFFMVMIAMLAGKCSDYFVSKLICPILPVTLTRIPHSTLLPGECHCFLWQKTLVLVLTVTLYLACYREFGLTVTLLPALLLMSCLLVISFVDWRCRMIFDQTLIFMTILVLLFRWSLGILNFTDMLCGGLVGGGILLIIALLSGGMGWGDVKLQTVIGFWLGLPLVLPATFIAFAAGGLVGAGLLLAKRHGRKDTIPFAPFLALGAMVTLFYGRELVSWSGF